MNRTLIFAASQRRSLILSLALVVLAACAFYLPRTHAEQPTVVPPPAVDETSRDTTAVALVAGGCFWGVQGVFQHVNGVSSAVSGYAGGEEKTAKYRTVGGGSTGHAETVRITYDPRRITYGELLRIYFSVAHDPTQLNRQGPDAGTQYRSTIFAANDEQARVARAYVDQLNRAKAFPRPVVTTIETGRKFYPAEDYHQDFLSLNPHHPYIVINDLPKVEALKQLFPGVYRNDPVLVMAGRAVK
jgi:peptide-methionine (S)-S-oxide reductase